MPSEPSWVHGTDVLAAIEAGSNAGQRARSLTDEENNAAARLKQSYDVLASQQAQQQRANALGQQQIDATTALKLKQQDALSAYRLKQQANQQDRIKDTESKASAAALLKQTQDDQTTSWFKQAAETDPEDATEKFPGADEKQTHPIISEWLKQKGSGTPKPITSAEKLKALTDAGNMMKVGTSETSDSPSFQSRTNLAGQLMRAFPVDSLLGTNSPTAAQMLQQPSASPVRPSAQSVINFVRDKDGNLVPDTTDASTSANP